MAEMNELNKKLAEFVWGKDNVKLLWGYTDPETGLFVPVASQLHPPSEYGMTELDIEQALCFEYPVTGSTLNHGRVTPDFPNDLNAIFKWLVPNHDITKITFTYYTDDVLCTIETYKGDSFEGIANMEQEALALCKAVELLIDAEKL